MEMKRFQFLVSSIIYSMYYCGDPKDEEFLNGLETKSSKAVLHFIDNWLDASKKYITVVQPNHILMNHANI